MNRHFSLVCLMILFNISIQAQTNNSNQPVVNPSEVVKSVMNWVTYESDHLIWSEDYVSLDTSFKVMERLHFLAQLTTGRFLPLKIKTENGIPCYQLHRLDQFVDQDIANAIRYSAEVLLRYSKMEGMELPDFNFVDLDKNIYNNETTKDKVVVINSWYINCGPCVKEMPDLNQIVKKYKKRKDVLFLALAFDPEIDIRKFLTKTTFDYKIVPEKRNYLMNVLTISGYPTQLVINRQGKIVKIIESNKLSELINVLDAELNK